MLSVLRRNKNSPVIIVLLGLVALLMIGFGVSINGSSGWPPAAKVGGEAIPGRQFQVAYAKEFQQRQAASPRYDRAAAEKENLRQQVLDRMVLIKRLAQLGEKVGLAVDDEALRQSILENPAFSEGGVFSRQQYERVLSMNQLTDQSYEAEERERLLAAAFLAAVSSVSTSDMELKQDFELQNRRVDISFVELNKASFEAQVGTIIPEDVKAWRAAEPEAKEQIAAYYKKHKAERYDVDKRVCLQSILIRTNKELPPDKQQALRDRATEAAKAIKGGLDFAAAAKRYSDDQNKDKGGQMGCLTAAQLPGNVAEAAFALKAGQVSGVVQTPFGLQILKATELKPAVHKTLDSVDGEIAEALTKEARANKLAKARASALFAEAKAAGSLQAMVEAERKKDKKSTLGVETTGPFPQGRSFLPKLGMAPKIAEAAWALTKEAPFPAGPMETSRAWVLIELKERQEADPADFDAAKIMLTYSEVLPKNQKLAEWMRAMTESAVTDVDPVAVSYAPEAERAREQRWQMARGR